ncbi:unnamed protein product [Haemonchus placei]|uniref:Eukaryotic translation initiation factor 3 subunit L n=1 Tax=Haemonchus placei TaxID=6290 RepID=A0A0N4W269_HAEPC|nr:unnamed protein product [Haemonchus placei]
MDGARVKFEPHTGDPERDLAYERERRRIVDEDGVPTEVADYLDYFAQMIEKKDVPEIHNLYEQHFPDLTERFYRERMWPDEQTVESIFQAFCLYKANPGKRSVDEVDELISIEEAQNAWNIYPVLNILYSLLSKSQINEQLAAIRARRNPDDVADEFGQSALYFKLGYFSLIGLLRTHVLLGDYHQALKTVENVEFDAKGLYNTVPSCLVTLHYFVGFSHMMMRNYGEATKMFVNCLMFIQRTKAIQTQQQKQKNFQYDVIGKTYDQLFHLLAICLAIQPQRIDESIASQLVERCGDRMSRMGNGDLDEFRLAFQMGCPKFLSPTTVVYEGSNLSKEPLLRQSQAFLEGVEAQMALPVLRGYLKLYTSLPTKKLASFMDVDDKNYDSFLGKLLTYKMVVNELGKDSLASSNDDDEPNTDIDFYVDKDMICIADTKVARRVGEHFIRHMQKLYEVSIWLLSRRISKYR